MPWRSFKRMSGGAAMKEKIQYVCLAKSIPEIDKRDDKLYTCSLGYSPQKGFIRLYPMPINGMSKWHMYEVNVERNKRDSRPASWKIATNSRYENFIGFHKDVKLIKRVSEQTENRIIRYLANHISPSISHLNKERKSIGVIRVSSLNPKWEINDRYINETQPSLFEDVDLYADDYQIYTKDTKEKVSRLVFNDADGTHDLQLNEWQYFEYARNNGYNKEAFRYINTNSDNLLLLGNMLQYQNNWMVLSVFKAPRNLMIDLFEVA